MSGKIKALNVAKRIAGGADMRIPTHSVSQTESSWRGLSAINDVDLSLSGSNISVPFTEGLTPWKKSDRLETMINYRRGGTGQDLSQWTDTSTPLETNRRYISGLTRKGVEMVVPSNYGLGSRAQELQDVFGGIVNREARQADLDEAFGGLPEMKSRSYTFSHRVNTGNRNYYSGLDREIGYDGPIVRRNRNFAPAKRRKYLTDNRSMTEDEIEALGNSNREGLLELKRKRGEELGAISPGSRERMTAADARYIPDLEQKLADDSANRIRQTIRGIPSNPNGPFKVNLSKGRKVNLNKDSFAGVDHMGDIRPAPFWAGSVIGGGVGFAVGGLSTGTWTGAFLGGVGGGLGGYHLSGKGASMWQDKSLGKSLDQWGLSKGMQSSEMVRMATAAGFGLAAGSAIGITKGIGSKVMSSSSYNRRDQR